jgi:hypothetical protein
MYKHAIATVLLLLLFNASVANARWFFTITPPNGGASFPVGPYKTVSQCLDTLGSAAFSHPFACHLQWSKQNCRIIGNGFAYPEDYPYPVPPDEVMTSVGCYEDNSGSYELRRGWYFFFYTAIGGSVEKCSQLKGAEELAREVPGDELGHYRNMGCPGAPCFSVGFDTACN